VGAGWLIFGLPPAEVAVHPSAQDAFHELYLMCSDIDAFVTEMRRRRIACSPTQRQDWGLLTHVTLPGGGKPGVYQPRPARPPVVPARSPPTTAPRRRTRRRKPR